MIRCPHCTYTHTVEGGRLLMVKPTFGLVKMKGDGISTHLLYPEHYLSKDRWQEVKNGAFYECGACGRPFGVNSEGAWVLPVPQQAPAPVPNGQPIRRDESEARVPRPPHLPDEDLMPEPNF